MATPVRPGEKTQFNYFLIQDSELKAGMERQVAE
jgi:hypothetical protein